MVYGRRIGQFDASYQEDEFHAKTVSKSRPGGVYKGAAFIIGLTRAAALSEAECVSTECEAKDEQTTGSSPDNESNLQELVSANGALTPSPESQVASAPGEEQQAALPEADDEIDGEWVLEIREPSYMPSGDKVTVNVVDGRFTANVSANGWRGSVSGRIDRSGILVASGYLRKPSKPSALLKWSSEPSGNRYNAKIPASTNFLSMTFEVSLYR